RERSDRRRDLLRCNILPTAWFWLCDCGPPEHCSARPRRARTTFTTVNPNPPKPVSLGNREIGVGSIIITIVNDTLTFPWNVLGMTIFGLASERQQTQENPRHLQRPRHVYLHLLVRSGRMSTNRGARGSIANVVTKHARNSHRCDAGMFRLKDKVACYIL